MEKHGSEDRGREVWTIRDTTLVGTGGDIVLTETNGDRFEFTVAGGTEMDRGEYWRA